ncbi:hypothetical protein [Rhodococcus aetherivorans]|nr:hypothetical protein [Rhodococcus aetherivorans]MBC2592375.1 hypothetical protein [Rhodococcus aetherivorans]
MVSTEGSFAGCFRYRTEGDIALEATAAFEATSSHYPPKKPSAHVFG